MCMAATYGKKDHFFGRNLDYEVSYGQKVVVTPRDYEFRYRNGILDRGHYAIIGMAMVSDGYPLYFDAMNDKGLGIAGLNFPGNAVYYDKVKDKDNIASFEFIPWVLGRCKDVGEAKRLVVHTNITNETFSKDLPSSPLHWMIADKNGSIVVEQTKSGMKVYDNHVGVMTNNPKFPYHMYNLANYMGLTAKVQDNRMCPDVELAHYSRGMGAIGLPGDLSSTSRFVRAVFTKMNSVADENDDAELTQFFHIMDSVKQVRGCCDLGHSRYEMTQYTSCCDLDNGVYYYRTYCNSQICGVDMHHVNLDSEGLREYPLIEEQHIKMQN